MMLGRPRRVRVRRLVLNVRLKRDRRGPGGPFRHLPGCDMKLFDRRYARPLSHFAPLPVRRGWKAVTAFFGRDDFSYVGLAPGDPARVAAEVPLPDPDPTPRPVNPDAEVRVCLHLHYPDLWPEFETVLKAWMPKQHDREPPSWGLIVTLTPGAASVLGDIGKAFPGARALVTENRGRDIGPFFELMHSGALDGAKAICKLHGKRSVSDKRPQLLGELWRRSATRSLLGQSAAIIDAMTRDAPLCVAAGPTHLLAPSARISEKSAWAGRRAHIEQWSETIGLPNPRIRFFAGSMFWLASPCIDQLKKLNLSLKDFEPETDLTIHSTTYTGERIFLIAAERSGGPIALLSPNGRIASFE